jgi:hypothetical protein
MAEEEAADLRSDTFAVQVNSQRPPV